MEQRNNEINEISYIGLKLRFESFIFIFLSKLNFKST